MGAKRVLVGDDPGALWPLAAPTALALVLDLAPRGRALAGYALQGKAIYASSLLISAGFWGLPLWGAARLARGAGPPGALRARVGLASLLGLWILPWTTFCFTN